MVISITFSNYIRPPRGRTFYSIAVECSFNSGEVIEMCGGEIVVADLISAIFLNQDA